LTKEDARGKKMGQNICRKKNRLNGGKSGRQERTSLGKGSLDKYQGETRKSGERRELYRKEGLSI